MVSELDDLGPISRRMCEQLATDAMDLISRKDAGEFQDSEVVEEMVGIVREALSKAIVLLEIRLDRLYELTGHEVE